MRLGWLAALAAMMISTQADAARWVRFTFTGPGQLVDDNVNDFEPAVIVNKDIVASFAIDVEPNDPFDGGDPTYFSNGSAFSKFFVLDGFNAAVGAGQLVATEQVADTKFFADSQLTFDLTNNASTFADIASGVGTGSLRYYIYYGYNYREAFASLTRVSVSDATGYEALNITAVPEPATWTTMILGVGAIGAQLRRRKRTEAAPVTA